MDDRILNKQIISPITGKVNVTKIKTFDVSWIINQWKRQFNYDVSYLFKELNIIELFRCNDTGYLFFKPEIEGDTKLYEHLQSFNWYYMPWKWEHEIAMKYLKDDIDILEIGCAEGDFLDKISKHYRLNVTGIEKNLLAIKRARKKGLNIHEELIEKYSLKSELKYDIICSFQVLEHIADVKSFINGCLVCLKSEGILIISVPNNLSFISEFDNLTNIPPHHAGLWDEHSLQKISSFFSITVESIFKEPLQEYHKEFFKATIYTKVFGKVYKNRVLRKLLKVLLLKPFIDKHIEYFAKWVDGHTIVAVYRKNKTPN